MSTGARIVVAALSLSIVGFSARLAHEGYTDRAIIPTLGDVPTVGFGSTVHEDGRRVQLGDRIDPVSAVRTAVAHFARDEAQIKSCIGHQTLLSPAEFDVYSELVYNVGAHTFCTNKAGGLGVIPKRLRAGDYRGACEAILEYRYAAGYDCTTLIDGQPNKRCFGVWLDRQRLHAQCIQAQP